MCSQSCVCRSSPRGPRAFPRMCLCAHSLVSVAVPPEALAFLGAVGFFLILLVVFFLYLNKKLCFSECGGFPCIDKPIKKEPKTNKLGKCLSVNLMHFHMLSDIYFVEIIFPDFYMKMRQSELKGSLAQNW